MTPPDLDIVVTANILIESYEAKAEAVATERAESWLTKGDLSEAWRGSS